ncbi:MAG: TonB-dependent receptor plug domain-containing protein [Puniceicoccaceae bacterium]
MKRRHGIVDPKLFWLGLAATSCLFTQVATAQDDADEEVYELSPFIVETDENIGYMATTTLAGTRIKTDLRDVGSAISVVTPEFLEDTGATNMEDLLVYTTSTEIGGALGNFAGSAVATGNEGENSNSRESPQNNNRVRGLSTAQSTRDYFLTAFSFDSYNSTGVTISRGPNSILFGIGEPGGIIENSLKKAMFGKDLTRVQFRLASRSSHRETIDINRELIEGRLALRVMGMNEKINFKQKPTYEDDQRYTIAATWNLLKNEDVSWAGPTIIRANYENAEIRGTPPNTMPPGDLYSTWWHGPGNPVADAMVGIDRGPTYEADYATQFISDQIFDDTTPGNKYRSQPNIWNSYVVVYDDIASGLPGLQSGSQRVEVIDGATGSFPITAPDGSMASTKGWFPMFSSSNNPWREYPGFRNLTIQDSEVFDWQNYFLPGRAQFANHDFEAYNLSLEQNLFNNKLGFQLVMDHQEKESHSHFPLGRAGYHSILIDTAKYLTSGELNPNIGRPLIAGMWDPERFSTDERESIRLTGYYNLDFTENQNFTRWLGTHTITGLLNSYKNDRRNYSMRMSWDDSHDPEQEFVFNQNKVGSWGGSMFFMAYVGDPQFGAATPQDLRLYDGYLNLKKPEVGDEFTNYYYHKGTDRKDIYYSTIRVQEFLQWPGGSYQTIDSKAATLQSKFLNDHVVFTYGWREDETKTYALDSSAVWDDGAGGFTFQNNATLAYEPEVFNYGWLTGNNWAEGTAHAGKKEAGAFNKANPVLDQSGETTTIQLVGHVPDSWLAWSGNAISALSFHYVESENFNPASVRRDIWDEVIGNPSGETEEHGFTVGMFDNKFIARLTWYKTSSNNITNPNIQGDLWKMRWPLGLAQRWLNAKNSSFQDGGLQFEDYAWYGPNGAGPDKEGAVYIPERLGDFTSFDQVINAFTQAFPAPWNQRVEGTENGNQTYKWDQPQGYSSVASAISDGFELELTWNVNRNWRVSFNASKTESIFGGGLQELHDFMDVTTANLVSSGLMTIADTPGEGGTTAGRWAQAESAYYAALSKENTVSTELRKWRWNLVTNYNFTDGKLKGFGVGGAVRWQDSVSTGYPLIRNDVDVLVPDLDMPYMGDKRWNGDVWFSYNTKISDLPVRFQLNFQNLLGDDDPIPVTTNPDGTLAIVRAAPEKRVFLTTTIDF